MNLPALLAPGTPAADVASGGPATGRAGAAGAGRPIADGDAAATDAASDAAGGATGFAAVLAALLSPAAPTPPAQPTRAGAVAAGPDAETGAGGGLAGGVVAEGVIAEGDPAAVGAHEGASGSAAPVDGVDPVQAAPVAPGLAGERAATPTGVDVRAADRPQATGAETAPGIAVSEDADVVQPSETRHAKPTAPTPGPVAPAPEAAAPTDAAVDPVATPDGPTSGPVPSTGTGSVAPAEPGATLSPTARRVMELVERAAASTPPTRFVVDVDGARVAVSVLGDGVRVSLAADGDRTPPWRHELAAALAQRGLSLAGEGAGGHNAGDRRRGHPLNPDPLAPASTHPTRPRRRDAGVRL